jgi:hypothetical protein
VEFDAAFCDVPSNITPVAALLNVSDQSISSVVAALAVTAKLAKLEADKAAAHRKEISFLLFIFSLPFFFLDRFGISSNPPLYFIFLQILNAVNYILNVLF